MFLRLNNKINVTLCGMMGSGKSAVGKMLAKKIDFNFIDTDAFIEMKIGKPIDRIFKDDGELYFRNLEEKNIVDILNMKKCVISLGGGAINSKIIRNCLKENSFNIYLKVKIDILSKRLANSTNRPLVKDKNIKKILTELIKTREKFYNKANLIIKNEISLNKVIDDIICKLKIYD